jgi:hypothetical protein
MNLESPHLTLEDLLAEVSQPGTTPAAAHLASCVRCRNELLQWSAVADGVRAHLVTATPSPMILDRVFATIDSGDTTRVRRIFGHAKSVRIGAAAALLAVGAGAYGLSDALGSAATHHSNAPSSATSAAFTDVTGCAGLEMAMGTLTGVEGSTLTIQTTSGQLVTVTTTSSTGLLQQARGSLADVVNGSTVIVGGTPATGTFIAQQIGVVTNSGAPARRQANPSANPSVQTDRVLGTAANVGSSGFTVVEPDGTNIAVATSPATGVMVVTQSNLSQNLSQLQLGARTFAGGAVSSDGTLAAKAIGQRLGAAGTSPSGAASGRTASGPNCSATAVVTSALVS